MRRCHERALLLGALHLATGLRALGARVDARRAAGAVGSGLRASGGIVSTTKDCPVCGRGFLNGKRALVPLKDGRLIRKTVCRRCVEKAERIITTIKVKACMVSGCQEIAHVCSKHVAEQVVLVRASTVADAVVSLKAMVLGMRAIVRNHGADDFCDGKIEGLEGAIELLTRTPETAGRE